MTREAIEMRLFDASDTPWIESVVDQVVASIGEPWRVLRDKLEYGPTSATRVAAILGALRRVIGGRAERARVAREVRAVVLGHPALDDSEHVRRLVAAGDQLGVAADAIRDLMWVDLGDERPVTLPSGRPAELKLAAFANLDKIQRAVRRARELRLRVWGDAHELIRTARRFGLLATVTVDGEATVLDVIGPLALFHDTTVYGRALAALIPLLAGYRRFEVEVHADFGYGLSRLRVASPVLLPQATPTRGKPSLAARLARDLAKAAQASQVELDPAPITTGGEVLYPDVKIDHGGAQWWIEILGFATMDYLAHRRACYAAAGVTHLLLCVHERAEGAPQTPRIIGFRGRVKAAAVLEALGNP